jgi:hypothetical protein
MVSVGRSSITPISTTAIMMKERGEGRPFLDRRAVGKARHQSEPGAEQEKDHAGDDRHVIAGDRQHVADAGHEHGVVEMLVDDVAAAVDQHGGDGAGIARQHGANARVDRIAQTLDEGIGALPNALRRRRRDDFYDAADKTRCADALEEHIAREIVGAGFERLHRRVEHRLDFDVGARVQRHAALDREPQALRLLIHAAAFHI